MYYMQGPCAGCDIRAGAAMSWSLTIPVASAVLQVLPDDGDPAPRRATCVSPRLCVPRHRPLAAGTRTYGMGSMSHHVAMWMAANSPYWNRTGGRDHIWIWAHDEVGAVGDYMLQQNHVQPLGAAVAARTSPRHTRLVTKARVALLETRRAPFT